MSIEKNWGDFVGQLGSSQYADRIKLLKDRNMDTSSIERTIDKTMKSLTYGENSSFVIFGEPQSGKTEMMIALNAKLLDDGCEVIINLLTDSVDLLTQNLSRFRDAGLSPAPKQFSELPSDPKDISGKQWVVFSKKNARDLEKLKDSLRFVKKLVIIDDEADYASPNSKVNKGDERTKINKLIHDLLEKRGKYIGVTATPARLDLNNTFENNTEHWVEFDPHPAYVGQDFFFPETRSVDYRLHTFSATQGNERQELRNAIFHFLCGVAEQHQKNNKENFTMIIHTSGHTDEHEEDCQVVEKTINVLADKTNVNFASAVEQLLAIAKSYNSVDPEGIVKFILQNIFRHQIVEINSKKKNVNIPDILKPKVRFSFGVGGNIISRGVTFDNLLSMYFTRGVKGKLTQDTYIQRARMFGSRSKYKHDFQLWITDTLMADWGKCFIFHKLAIQSARSEMGAPVWLSDSRIIPTSPASIDRSSVDFEDGEMSFELFNFSTDGEIMGNSTMTNKDRFAQMQKLLPPQSFPEYILNYVLKDATHESDICFHKPSQFGTDKAAKYAQEEIDHIRRTKGIFSNNEFSRGDRPNARHHFKIFYNSQNKARLFYKVNGLAIRFIQNKK